MTSRITVLLPSSTLSLRAAPRPYIGQAGARGIGPAVIQGETLSSPYRPGSVPLALASRRLQPRRSPWSGGVG